MDKWYPPVTSRPPPWTVHGPGEASPNPGAAAAGGQGAVYASGELDARGASRRARRPPHPARGADGDHDIDPFGRRGLGLPCNLRETTARRTFNERSLNGNGRS